MIEEKVEMVFIVRLISEVAEEFGVKVLFEAILWPAFVVYYLLEFLKM